MTAEQIRVACNWWGNALRRPKFDAGADSPQLAMTEEVLERTAEYYSITEEQIASFKVRLTTLLEKDPNGLIGFYGLHVDYDPDATLREALTHADIPTSRAPIKTNMNFHDGGVYVSYGYGAPWEKLL